ncbi:hypothetical protein Prudu_016925 [Prunus dulcis]|uniref:Uncharacterized protein n=1 Tax=Prunus dulcis TaxID=3755 RepID=A0A4Y1RNU3_PRUDU|nr:hypothetical protein Prudu_016925 [Prunus dulcis]
MQVLFAKVYGNVITAHEVKHFEPETALQFLILTTNCSAYHKMEQEMSPQKNEAENQPKRRIKTMAQKSKPKPKPNYDRKAKHPDYVQFRCNAYAFNSIIRDVKDKLNERQKKLLKKTPFWNLIELLSNAVSESFNFIVQGILKTYKKRKTTGEEGDPLDKKKEKEYDEGQKGEAEEAGKEPLAIQDLLVKSMTDQINYRQQEDPSFVCPERLQLWKDEKNEDSEKKMKDLWDIFIQAEKRSKELEVELATYMEKLDNEECVTATMTVESTIQLNEIQNLKRRIAELEGKETRIDMEKIAKKKEIQGKYKAEIESLLSDPTIFEMEMDLPTKQPTQPVEEKEEEKKEEEKQQEEREEENGREEKNKELEKQQEEREEEKKQDAPTPAVPSRVQRLKNRERKRLQASCYVYEKNKKTKRRQKRMMKNYHNSSLSRPRRNRNCNAVSVPAMQCVICFTETETAMQFPVPAMQCLTQEASQPDATNPIPDPPKGTSLHDSIPVGLEQSSDEDEGQKKPTKKKLGWGQGRCGRKFQRRIGKELKNTT